MKKIRVLVIHILIRFVESWSLQMSSSMAESKMVESSLPPLFEKPVIVRLFLHLATKFLCVKIEFQPQFFFSTVFESLIENSFVMVICGYRYIIGPVQ